MQGQGVLVLHGPPAGLHERLQLIHRHLHGRGREHGLALLDGEGHDGEGLQRGDRTGQHGLLQGGPHLKAPGQLGEGVELAAGQTDVLDRVVPLLGEVDLEQAVPLGEA